MRILIVEDDALLRGMLARALQIDRYVVEEAATLAEARRKAARGRFDVLLIDWNLPDGSGTDLIAAYRAAGGSAGTILITGRTSIDDQVTGLEAGADDFVGKPFEIAVLKAKIRALRRRPLPWARRVATIGDLTLDFERKVALVRGRALDLTAKEWQLLALLAELDGSPASRAEVVGQLWDDNHEPELHALMVHISNLRHKLAASGSVVSIATRRGIGYLLECRQAVPQM